jgi:hypothetical protein
MDDYRKRIQDRADVVNLVLSNEQLAVLNQRVNDSISMGSHESDALDYAYFYIKNHYLPKHSKCRGYKYWTDCGYEYDCGYETEIACEECKYGGGRKDPEAKSNS